MDAEKGTLREVAGAWCARLAEALESLCGEAVTFELSDAATGRAGESALCCRQRFSLPGDAPLWVAAEAAVRSALGGKVLAAAGVEDADAECAYLDLLSQAGSGFAHMLMAKTGQEVTCAESAACEMPDGREWFCLRILSPVPAELAISCAPAWGDIWRQHEQTETMPVLPPVLPPDRRGAFDLLLDVELPVSVSFGRASLQIKDALKLTTGSVVELDRAVNEPVDVLVNNRVIARGEVVVVDGNYGVRIARIMSRDERMRSLE